jgi:hypothetical protein
MTSSKAQVLLEVFTLQDVQMDTVTVSVQAGYPTYLVGANVCIREYGSSRPCGSSGTISARILNPTGGTFIFDAWSLNARFLGYGDRLLLEIVVESPYFWQYGDSLSVAVNQIRFDYDGRKYPLSYPTASVAFVR